MFATLFTGFNRNFCVLGTAITFRIENFEEKKIGGVTHQLYKLSYQTMFQPLRSEQITMRDTGEKNFKTHILINSIISSFLASTRNLKYCKKMCFPNL